MKERSRPVRVSSAKSWLWYGDKGVVVQTPFAAGVRDYIRATNGEITE